MLRFLRVAQVLHRTFLRERRTEVIGMSQNQKSITSFFSSKPSSLSPTSPFSQLKTNSTSSQSKTSKSPNVLKEKPATKNSKARSSNKSEKSPKRVKTEESPVEAAITTVKKVRISEEVVDEDAPDSPVSSPVKSGKRRRVQILESDDSGSDTENIVTTPATLRTPPSASPSSIPKRKTAKLSKESRSKLANRVQTPHANKQQVPEDVSSPEEMETSPTSVPAKPSPITSKLTGFSYKKRGVTFATPSLPEKTESDPPSTVVDTPHPNKLNVNLKQNLISSEQSSPKDKKKSLNEKKESAGKERSPTNSKNKQKQGSGASNKQTPDSEGSNKQTLDSGASNKQTSDSGASKSSSLVSATSHDGYNPGRAGYKPIENATWKSGQDVPYKALSDTLKAIEGTKGRLEKTLILSNFLRSVCILTPDDLHLCICLCTNQVAPAYKGIELGVGETVVMRAIREACGVNIATQKSKVGKLGDLGLVAESSRANQKMMFKPKPLTVKNVFDTFLQITAISGNQGQAQKISLIKKLLVSAQGSEARYVTRSLLGKLRCGLADQTVLVSLGHATVLTPPGGDKENNVPKKRESAVKEEAADIVKTCYCEYPNFEHIIKMIREHGVLKSAEFCRLTPGIPVKPMLATPTKGISEVLHKFEGSEFTCEYKYDGERAQVQCDESGEISIFSRNQENNTSKYPDVISRLGNCLEEGTKSFILDSEVVAWDVENEHILPFQILTTRKRKDADINEIKVKVCLFAFDLLYLNGESLIRKPFRRRRELLHSAFKAVPGEFIFATARDCNETEEIQVFLEESIKGQCEGLMVKTLDNDATYEIAKRSHNWLKVKKDYLEGCGDSLDLVVIGAFLGKGKRSGTYGGFLLACYDTDTEQYQAICKIGTGFTDEDLSSHYTALAEHVISQAKPYYSYPESSAPEVWFEPALVWEVKCADMTISPVYTAGVGLVDPDKGISLRFPRFIRIRDDKGADDATSAEQVAELYNKQENKQEQTKEHDDEDEDY